jgi:hypothetical protein
LLSFLFSPAPSLERPDLIIHLFRIAVWSVLATLYFGGGNFLAAVVHQQISLRLNSAIVCVLLGQHTFREYLKSWKALSASLIRLLIVVFFILIKLLTYLKYISILLNFYPPGFLERTAIVGGLLWLWALYSVSDALVCGLNSRIIIGGTLMIQVLLAWSAMILFLASISIPPIGFD